MTDVFDGIGQKINPGDFVMSVRDGTGAKPRIVISFTTSKVKVSDWGVNTTNLDACNLVVITENLKVLQAAGSQFATEYLVDMTVEWKDKIEAAKPAKAAATPPLRFLIVGHIPKGLDYSKSHDRSNIQRVSIHEVRGAGNDAVSSALAESTLLSEVNGWDEEEHFILHRETFTSRYSLKSETTAWFHTSGYGESAKHVLWPLAQLRVHGLDGAVTNELMTVDQFNSCETNDDYKVKQ